MIELVVDVLKELIIQKADMTREEVNQVVIRKTIGISSILILHDPFIMNICVC